MVQSLQEYGLRLSFSNSFGELALTQKIGQTSGFSAAKVFIPKDLFVKS